MVRADALVLHRRASDWRRNGQVDSTAYAQVMAGLSGDLSASAARQQLESNGYVIIGVGDWATVFARPGDLSCVRLVPVDPAYRLFAEDLLTGPSHTSFPHVHELLPLKGDAFAVVLERLWPADEAAAQLFCDRLSDDPALWSRIAGLEAKGAERYPHLWGGLDIRPGNVLSDATGELKLIDPVFLAGEKVVDALRAVDRVSLSDLTRSEVEAFPDIACFHRVHDRYEGVEELKQLIAHLFWPTA